MTRRILTYRSIYKRSESQYLLFYRRMNAFGTLQRKKVIIKVNWRQLGKKKEYEVAINDKMYDYLLEKCKSYQYQKTNNREQFKLMVEETKTYINNLQDLINAVSNHQQSNNIHTILNIQAVTRPSLAINNTFSSQSQMISDRNSQILSYETEFLHNTTQLPSLEIQGEAVSSIEYSIHYSNAQNNIQSVPASTLIGSGEMSIYIAQGIKCHYCNQPNFKGPIYQCSHLRCRVPCGGCPLCKNKQQTKCKDKLFMRICSLCQYKHFKNPISSRHSLIKIISKQQLQYQDYILKPSSLQLPAYDSDIFEKNQLKSSQIIQGSSPNKAESKMGISINISNRLQNGGRRNDLSLKQSDSGYAPQSELMSMSHSHSQISALSTSKKGLIARYNLSEEEAKKFKRIMNIFKIQNQQAIEPYLKAPFKQMSFEQLKKQIKTKRAY